MFKIQFCGNIAQRCLGSPIFGSKVSLISNSALPEILSKNERRTRSKLRFKDSNSAFPGSNPMRSHNNNPWDPSIKPTLKESEQQFLVRVKNNPDTFGDSALQSEYIDEGDVLEERHFTQQPSPHKKLSTKQYADIIKDYIRERKIKEAIDVLEINMIQEDRVKPENYIYNLLLGACGRVGYTKKAFMLYNDMKKRGLKVTGGTYTALFNACSNSPWPLTDGLNRAKHLYDIMIEKGDQPNDTNYNAMIKAFGRCGDLTMAFSLVDEMTQKGFVIKDDTINFLLQACISDKETGFRHSLLVWRKLVEKNIRPTVYTFNLMLRCVRDCGLGDLEATKHVINKLVEKDISYAIQEESESLKLEGDVETETKSLKDQEMFLDSIQKVSAYSIPKNTDESGLISISNSSKKASSMEVIENLDLRPNLLAKKPHLGNILSLSEVKKPEDRLLLLGGSKGFLETMLRYQCTADIKTYTQLLDCIPSTLAAEKELVVAMKKLSVQADIDFYNMLIKKKSLRFDYEGAKEVLTSMKQMKFRPDLITYGVLSLGCKTKDEAMDLVNQMKATGYTLNSAILGAMLKQACFHMKFDYLFEIMELCLKESVPVNKKFLEHLEMFKEKCRTKLDTKELNNKEVKMFAIFKARYKTWLTEVQIDDSENAHPWQQYRQTYPQNTNFRPKDDARFKPRHNSAFKLKTSTKYRNYDRF